MRTFRDLIKESTVESKHEIEIVQFTLAEAALTAIELGSERSCYLLYCAITHLAYFTELRIIPEMYEYLLYSPDQKMSADVYNIIKEYFYSAKQLLGI